MIREAELQDLPIVAKLACCLWPAHTTEEMQADLAQLMKKADIVYFLAFIDQAAVGFAQCQLRRDYVEGTDSSPVGYLEGIYVAKVHRHKGIARDLLHACENWAKAQGCSEFASDCELTNTESLQFHLNVGFQEANRIICFTKKL